MLTYILSFAYFLTEENFHRLSNQILACIWRCLKVIGTWQKKTTTKFEIYNKQGIMFSYSSDKLSKFENDKGNGPSIFVPCMYLWLKRKLSKFKDYIKTSKIFTKINTHKVTRFVQFPKKSGIFPDIPVPSILLYTWNKFF